MGWVLQLTGQQDQTTQELQEQLAVSHSKVSVATALFRPLYRREAGVEEELWCELQQMLSFKSVVRKGPRI